MRDLNRFKGCLIGGAVGDALGARAAALPHGHELGYIPAAMLVHILQQIIDHGNSILEVVRSALFVIPTILGKVLFLRLPRIFTTIAQSPNTDRGMICGSAGISK